MAEARRGVRWRALTAALLAALLTGLAGCDGDEAPSPAPLEPSSPSPTEPTGSPAPTLPAAAQGESPRAAQAFTRYWIDALNYATRTGETQQMGAQAERCRACVAIADFIDDVYRNGGRIDSQGWGVESIGQPVVTPTGLVLVDVSVDASPQKIHRPGKRVQSFPGGPSIKSFQLRWQGDEWSLVRLDQS
jgi:hypothetical protein